jgi:hypothetical protein
LTLPRPPGLVSKPRSPLDGGQTWKSPRRGPPTAGAYLRISSLLAQPADCQHYVRRGHFYCLKQGDISPKLRHRHHPLHLLFPAGFSYVHVLPIRIQRYRYAVFLDPSTHVRHALDCIGVFRPARREGPPKSCSGKLTSLPPGGFTGRRELIRPSAWISSRLPCLPVV